jgi:hypothetical protein
MNNLIFKTSDDSLDYIERWFTIVKLKKKESYHGVVRHIDKTKHPNIYAIEIVVKTGLFASKTIRQLVMGTKHPEMKLEPVEGDLVIWGYDFTSMKIPTGYVLYLLKNELNTTKNAFEFESVGD